VGKLLDRRHHKKKLSKKSNEQHNEPQKICEFAGRGKKAEVIQSKQKSRRKALEA
jgi:hypothetical protein